MAESKRFHCKVVTPDAKILDEDVSYASIPAWDGLIGVLPNRAPMVAKLGLGELRLEFPDKTGGKGGSRAYLVDGGFVKVAQNKVSILASYAVPVEQLTESDASAEVKELEARQVPADQDNRDQELQRLSKERARANRKLELAKKYKGQAI